MKRATIMDVARACGLSKTTVSVILNASPASARVPQNTRLRVKEAADKLGYRPSWRGKALASRRTHMIGVLYAPPMPLVVRGNYEGILAGIHEILGARGYHLLMVPLGDRPAEWETLLGDQRMDGAIVLSRLLPELADLITRFRLPVALVNADTPLPFPCVVPDDFDGALETTRHLITLGHERIAFAMSDPPPHFSVTRRQDGYRSAMREAGLERHTRVIDAPADRMVDAARGCTAVVAYTHYLAVKLLNLFWQAGVRVPQDVSVTGFGNAYPVEDTVPPLTTVALPTEEMGRQAGRLILEQVENGEPTPPRRVVLKETLIVRKSTAAPGA
jgi:LacI family transcriptional regulator